MKFTNYTILNMLAFLEQAQTKNFPQKIQFAIIKNIKTLAKEREVYQEALSKILEKHSENFVIADGAVQYEQNGFPKINTEENQLKFYTDVQELLDIEVEINLYKVDDELLNYDSERYDTLSGNELFNLMTIICNEE